MIAAADWFDEVWPKRGLSFYAPLAISVCSPFVQILMLSIGHRFTYGARIITCYVAYTFLVIFLPVTVTVVAKDAAFYIAMALMIAIGAVNAVVTSTLFGYAAMFPPKYTQGLMAGQGWSGVIVSLVRCITKASFPADEAGQRDGSFLYFSIAAFVTLLCVVGYIYMTRSPFVQHFLDARNEADGITNSGKHSLLDEEVGSSRNGVITLGASSDGDDAVVNGERTKGLTLTLAIAVIHKLKWTILNVLGVFVMTFLCFPGLIVSMEPSFSMSKGWFTLFLITEFNILDLIGRSLPTIFVAFTPDNVWIPVLLRFIFYPLIFLCSHPAIFTHSAWGIIFVFLFSISNGYLSSLVMMFGPGQVKDDEKAAAGGLMSLFLNVGILLGSSIALIIAKTSFGE